MGDRSEAPTSRSSPDVSLRHASCKSSVPPSEGCASYEDVASEQSSMACIALLDKRHFVHESHNLYLHHFGVLTIWYLRLAKKNL